MADVPCINSECGNVWGIFGNAGESDISWQYKYMMNEFRLHDKLCGSVFTEFHDVVNEFNGYYKIDNGDKDFGYDIYGMTIKDLRSQDYLGCDPGANRNSFPQTDAKKWGGMLEVSIDGCPCGNIYPADDPADSRGALSHHYQPVDNLLEEAGSYGTLCDILIPSDLL